MYCNLTPPQPSTRIAGAFVYSLSDCADICASYNFSNNSTSCGIAFYQPLARRPSNCWIAQTQMLIGSLEAKQGTEVGILVSPL